MSEANFTQLMQTKMDMLGNAGKCWEIWYLKSGQPGATTVESRAICAPPDIPWDTRHDDTLVLVLN